MAGRYRVEVDEYGTEEWFRPSGERLALVEMMEDRTFFRDLAPLLEELNDLYQALDALVAALDAVEFVGPTRRLARCSWCGGDNIRGHIHPCQRQDALRLAKVEAS